MAYAQQPNDFITNPPPYPAKDGMNFGAQYQSQAPLPAQPPYYIAQPPPPVIMYTSQPTIIGSSGFLGHNPQTMQCPSCQQQIITIVHYEIGTMTWLIALLICFFGGFIGCFLIPFCVPACQDAVHTCPACHNTLGRRSPF